MVDTLRNENRLSNIPLTLELPAPAKLNLFLHITGRREDGYHELQTAFQILNFGDTLQFERTTDNQITVLPAIPNLPQEENLIYKAAHLLKPFNKRKYGARITLAKRLPMGGGVGGGSSDAASTLLGLNLLWDCSLSRNELSTLGLQLGADVPVFINGKTAFAEGVGEQLHDLKTPSLWYVVLSPKVHVSTAQIFSNELLTRDTPKMKIAPALEGQALDRLHNDCEPLVAKLYPEIQSALDWLSQFGQAKMTGTGACCFCALSSEAEARQVLNEANPKFKGFIAKGVSLSPAIKRLSEAERFATNPSK
ncbi:4-(cytidine 5'-diphospho)-2-C-methyl-D-erythritol kinase [Oleiphilus sp. HI0071]|uniref:4-(cytidine 5'-diphospho)-2-C-methyl-D-erythritol kinase n=1 Tax=unclassified Oleiphilus TaxID=2631174 RepID=UPI0007C2758E|nr:MULTISPECIES: 4-(cytidine 5'-diphospho)-2-C-methyl-D-erythritol kinase [unclassified Oleiphilus]KZY72459.1 4-(cytidine 5'-diphospho)-2-C-methyl-D-erythritol kinase [Oleiphilus sp. HI0065]KZY83700.1 4-(cytidine 5'-diphospho)-2-C-methyl-D-erythritol kinase [Oleiphilus sp. HI0071]KZZ04730.1 4-(cytidine 5'-diphospho)-2-C-methyl-D-erythritol kinase [Oleiphilus sp. HI0073]KZZ52697.1 4-(cytidine 5'-diphospho)-2-C-methyl-D-erythritol kinase [Oleiphilus sp. HI0122]KZZ81115.1 4-(cytidine 5'-diphospho